MYVEDVMSRYNQVFEPAKKTEKYEHVRVMNDEFLSGRLKVQRGGQYEAELSTLPKDPNWDPESGKPPGEDPRFPNHLCDSALYSFRKAFAHLDFKEETEEPMDPIEKMDEERLAGNTLEDWWESEEYDGSVDDF